MAATYRSMIAFWAFLIVFIPIVSVVIYFLPYGGASADPALASRINDTFFGSSLLICSILISIAPAYIRFPESSVEARKELQRYLRTYVIVSVLVLTALMVAELVALRSSVYVVGFLASVDALLIELYGFLTPLIPS